MFTLRHLLAVLILLGGLAVLRPAQAAQSYDNCAGFIDALPATVVQPGTWCLRHDLATSMGSGDAIAVAADRVTIDCNDFRLDGSAAGGASTATGIHSYGHRDTTVRHCAVRGFQRGIMLHAGGGFLVEDNRLDGNLLNGILVDGDSNRVLRNIVTHTGNASVPGPVGINASGDVIDNTVAYLTGTSAQGIQIRGAGGEARRNRVRDITASTSFGISVQGTGIRVEDNQLYLAPGGSGFGIAGYGATDTVCIGNTVTGFTYALNSCQDAGGNVTH